MIQQPPRYATGEPLPIGRFVLFSCDSLSLGNEGGNTDLGLKVVSNTMGGQVPD